MLLSLLLLVFAQPMAQPRCGMLYMDGAPLTWDLLVATWTHTLPEAINRSLREMVSFVMVNMSLVMVNMSLVMANMSLVMANMSLMVITPSFIVVIKI